MYYIPSEPGIVSPNSLEKYKMKSLALSLLVFLFSAFSISSSCASSFQRYLIPDISYPCWTNFFARNHCPGALLAFGLFDKPSKIK